MKKETKRNKICKICGGVVEGIRLNMYCAECYLVQKHTTFIKQDGVVISKISKSDLDKWKILTKRECPFPVLGGADPVRQKGYIS